MSISKAVALTALVAVSHARFGQEQIPVDAVRQLGDAGFGDPGVAATIAGSIPGALLGGANPCEQLTVADQIIDELGTDQAVVDAAVALVAAEKNFNPFEVDVANDLSEQSVAAPFDAEGLSQAEVLAGQGFTNFNAVDSDGASVDLTGQDGDATEDETTEDGATGDDSTIDDAVGDGNTGDDATGDGGTGDNATGDNEPAHGVTPHCGGGVPINGTHSGNGTGNANEGHHQGNGNNQGNNDDQDSDTNTLDFGLCQPTMARVGGLNGRPADEFTFIPQDPLVAEGQQEALNPNIITNRICDQLINVCEASDEAVAACEDAQAQIGALGTRDQSTANAWNALLGFEGVDSAVETI
ncbi:hypothetical protein ACO1O0_003963 [Amphichorda felina]